MRRPIKVTWLQIPNSHQIERYQRLSGSYGFLIPLITRLEGGLTALDFKMSKGKITKNIGYVVYLESIIISHHFPSAEPFGCQKD